MLATVQEVQALFEEIKQRLASRRQDRRLNSRGRPRAFAFGPRDRDNPSLDVDVRESRKPNLFWAQATRREDRNQKPRDRAVPSGNCLCGALEPLEVLRVEYGDRLRKLSRESDVSPSLHDVQNG